MPLDPNLAGLLQLVNAAPKLSDGTPDQARVALRMLMVNTRDPAAVPQVGDVADGFAGGVPVRVYRPEPDGPCGSIVYLHGGGFVVGDLDTHDSVCRRLCRDAGAVVVSVDYRLAPEHPYPAAVDDAYAALVWVLDHTSEYGDDPARVMVGGDSAGGNLAAVCAQLAAADGRTLAGQLLIYPAVDFAGDYPSRVENADGYFLTAADMVWFAQQYTGLDPASADPVDVAATLTAPRLSPLRTPALAGLAPAVVATAEFDPLRDEGEAYAAALRAAGVAVTHRRFDGLIHGFVGLEQFSPTVLAATDWVNAQVADLLR